MPRNCKLCNTSLENCTFITKISISQRNDSTMDGDLNVYKCENCILYFTSSNSSEDDYNHYYTTHNNYSAPLDYYDDKTLQTFKFIDDMITDKNATIIDYGCGNKQLYNSVKRVFKHTDCYDVGYPDIEKTYDYVILSHVLEHIYDPKKFIDTIKRYINKDGYLYIEVPNADGYYETHQSYGMLQEINIEHINFFTPVSLVKFMLNCGFTTECIKTGYFNLNNKCDYPVIRSLFKLSSINSFESYIEDGQQQLSSIINMLPATDKNVIVYGCGQYLYKLIRVLKTKYNIPAIIDDNPNFIGKTLLDIPVYTSEYLRQNYSSDTNTLIMITSRVHEKIITEKLKSLNINLEIMCCA